VSRMLEARATLVPDLCGLGDRKGLQWKVKHPNLDGKGLHRMTIDLAYDAEVDTLWISFSEAPIVESDEAEVGIIFDYDAEGHIVQIEILQASKRIGKTYAAKYNVGWEVTANL